MRTLTILAAVAVFLPSVAEAGWGRGGGILNGVANVVAAATGGPRYVQQQFVPVPVKHVQQFRGQQFRNFRGHGNQFFGFAPTYALPQQVTYVQPVQIPVQTYVPPTTYYAPQAFAAPACQQSQGYSVQAFSAPAGCGSGVSRLFGGY